VLAIAESVVIRFFGVAGQAQRIDQLEFHAPARTFDFSRRAASDCMMRRRSLSSIPPQRAISSSVRPQPVQMPACGSSAQILMQGDEIIALI
jgi:hypothetical protein